MKKILLLSIASLAMLMADFTLIGEQLTPVTEPVAETTPTATEPTAPTGEYTVVPGVYGFGTDTRAAYGGTVDPKILHVNTLASGVSNTDSTHGSFEWAVTQTFPRIIVFDVSGVIHGPTTHQIIVRDPYLTIAGQTAPGPVVMDDTYAVFQTHDVLIQHIGFTGNTQTSGISLSVNTANGNPVYNFVVDHAMICWGIDDNNDFWANTTGSLYDVTLSNNIYAEGLYKDGDVNHAKGLLVLGDRVSIFGNMFHSNAVRNPYLSVWGNGKVSEYIVWNNLTYNYVKRQTMVATATAGISNGTNKLSYVGNVSIDGPSTDTGYVPGRYLIHSDFYNNANNNTLLVQMEDNINGVTPISGINLWDGDTQTANVGYTVDNDPVTLPDHTPYAASLTKTTVLANVGPRPNSRGALESRFVSEVSNGTGSVKTTRPAMPAYTELTVPFVPVANPHDMYNIHYTNLENQLHQLAEAVEK